MRNKYILLIIPVLFLSISCNSRKMSFDFETINYKYINDNKMKLEIYYFKSGSFNFHGFTHTPDFLKENYQVKIIVNTKLLRNIAELFNKIKLITSEEMELVNINFNVRCDIFLKNKVVYSYAFSEGIDNSDKKYKEIIWINGKYYKISQIDKGKIIMLIPYLFIPDFNLYEKYIQNK